MRVADAVTVRERPGEKLFPWTEGEAVIKTKDDKIENLERQVDSCKTRIRDLENKRRNA